MPRLRWVFACLFLAGCVAPPNPQAAALSALDFDRVSVAHAARVGGSATGGKGPGEVLGYPLLTGWQPLNWQTEEYFVSVVRSMIRTELAKYQTAPGTLQSQPLGLAAKDFTPQVVVDFDTERGWRHIFIDFPRHTLCICNDDGQAWTEAYDDEAAQLLAETLPRF